MNKQGTFALSKGTLKLGKTCLPGRYSFFVNNVHFQKKKAPFKMIHIKVESEQTIAKLFPIIRVLQLFNIQCTLIVLKLFDQYYWFHSKFSCNDFGGGGCSLPNFCSPLCLRFRLWVWAMVIMWLLRPLSLLFWRQGNYMKNTFKIFFLSAVFAVLATDSKYLDVTRNILNSGVVRPLLSKKIKLFVAPICFLT